ncbi:LLM class flavin-dependent oxidoreductase [Nocardioides sp. W7]|uniref:LLM class flavin-dependent oxidoreductase n=1 Tax=Nocardioides sp. W7 TaxID=2931390 RepID=UPI001FD19059|nr:LLM class flavin-dependent oxidoreductase [Nocardioides sp. W7]
MSRQLAIGLLFDLRNPRPWARPWPEVIGGALDLAVEAEHQGADSIWATEHHGFEDGYLSQPLTFLAAAAARTSTVRLGTGVLLAAMRHPRHVSEQAALIDNLSGGRLELGVGAGYAPAEFATFGRDLGRRMSLADQSVRDLMADLWGADLTPGPLQPRIPLWLGYQGPQGARRAGRLGVGLLSPDPRLLGPYGEGLAEGGHEPGTAVMGGLVPMVLSSDPERAANLLAPHYAHQARTYAQARHADGPRVPSPDLAEVAAGMLDPGSRGLRVVTVDTATEELTAIVSAAPIRHLYFWASVAAMPDVLVDEHLALVLGQLAPRLRTR